MVVKHSLSEKRTAKKVLQSDNRICYYIPLHSNSKTTSLTTLKLNGFDTLQNPSQLIRHPLESTRYPLNPGVTPITYQLSLHTTGNYWKPLHVTRKHYEQAENPTRTRKNPLDFTNIHNS